MKKILSIALFLFALTGLAQNNATPSAQTKQISMSKLKLAEIKTITEIFTDLPLQYKSISNEVAGKCNGKLLTASWTGQELSAEAKNILKNADLGSKLFFDSKITDKTISSLSISILVD